MEKIRTSQGTTPKPCIRGGSLGFTEKVRGENFPMTKPNHQKYIRDFHTRMIRDESPKSSWDKLLPQTTKAGQDLIVQSEAVVNILQSLIYNVEIGTRFYALFRSDFEQIREYCSKKDAEFIKRTLTECAKYPKYDRPDSVCELITGFKINTSVIECFRMIFTNNQLMHHLKHAKFNAKPTVKNLINMIAELRKIFRKEMKVSAVQVVNRYNKLKECYHLTRARSLNMKNTTDVFDERRAEHKKRIAEKKLQMERVHEKTIISRNEHKIRILCIMDESEKAIIKENLRCTALKDELLEEARVSRAKFEDIITEHKKIEKQMRIRKYKLDTQLQQWIDKYDYEIGARQIEFRSLTEQYEHNAFEHSELVCLMKEHQRRYNQCKQEKAAEEKRILDEKIFALMSERAAKIIQRAWRAYRLRKKKRKRRKNVKKGKK